jgi:hypothetical protein
MDPDNIFQILMGQSPADAPANILQAVAPPSAPATPSAPAPRQRRSLVDIIGHLADGIAQAGGATPMYQQTLDAMQKHEFASQDQARQIDADTIKLATDKFALGDAHNTRLGHVARGLQAIKAAGGDINQAWPALAQRMQIDPETIESVGQAIASDPNALDGLVAATTDPKYDQSKYGGSVVYGKDPKTGNLVAYQPSLGNDTARSILPEGIQPIDPLKFIDTGGAQVGVGTRSGNSVRVLPKSEKPGYRGGVPINEKAGFRGGRPIAPLPSKEGATPSTAMVETAQGNLDELRQIYGDLNKMGAMVSTAQSADKNVVARIRASGLGQTLEGAVGTKAQSKRDRIASIRPQLMQSLAKATGMTGKQLDSNADVKLFMQTVTDPTKSYQANVDAINGLERFLKANAKKPATPAPSARPSTVRPQAKSGWTVVEVK